MTTRPTLHLVLAAFALRFMACVVLGWGLLVATAHAESDVRNLRIDLTDEGYVLNADLSIELSPRITQAIERGVAIYFVSELNAVRPRWYWLDDKAISAQQTWRLSYNALARQYRLSSGSLGLPFSSLNDAVNFLSRVRNWRFAERGALSQGYTYQFEYRFRLDTTQLPAVFQNEPLNNRDWQLSTGWKKIGFSINDAHGRAEPTKPTEQGK